MASAAPLADGSQPRAAPARASSMETSGALSTAPTGVRRSTTCPTAAHTAKAAQRGQPSWNSGAVALAAAARGCGRCIRRRHGRGCVQRCVSPVAAAPACCQCAVWALLLRIGEHNLIPCCVQVVKRDPCSVLRGRFPLVKAPTPFRVLARKSDIGREHAAFTGRLEQRQAFQYAERHAGGRAQHVLRDAWCHAQGRIEKRPAAYSKAALAGTFSAATEEAEITASVSEDHTQSVAEPLDVGWGGGGAYKKQCAV